MQLHPPFPIGWQDVDGERCGRDGRARISRSDRDARDRIVMMLMLLDDRCMIVVILMLLLLYILTTKRTKE